MMLSVFLCLLLLFLFFFFSSRRRHTRCLSDWSSDVCSSDLVRFVSPEDVGWRRNVCSRDGGVLSVVIGITLTRGSADGNRRVVGPNVGASRSRNPISNGEPRIPITSAVPMRGKRKSTERALITCASTASSIPTTCGATQFPSKNGARN